MPALPIRPAARWAGVLLLASVCSWPGVATAGPALAAQQTWLAVADHRLAGLRGGFAAPGGVLVSFGISRTVLVDGQLVAELHIPQTELRSLTPLQAQWISTELAQSRLVQSGPGNLAAPDLAAGTAAFVVQNSLNDRQIQSITQIDAASNGMGLLKQMNLGETLQRALAAGRP